MRILPRCCPHHRKFSSHIVNNSEEAMTNRTETVRMGVLSQEYTPIVTVLPSLSSQLNSWMSQLRWSSPVSPSSDSSNNLCLSQRHHQNHPIYYSLNYFRRTYLIPLLYLLTLTSSSVMARPTSPNWTNPCGLNKASSGTDDEAENVDFNSEESKDYYKNIKISATEAKIHAEAVKDEFVRETFESDASFMHEFDWLSYDWLPTDIPSSPTVDDYKNLGVPELLKRTYEHQQKFAVAIEQLILDQLQRGNFVDPFKKMEENLKMVLCQLQKAMIVLRVEQEPDVSKDVMSEEYRTISSDTLRSVRDYIIMRDHIVALDYIVKGFEYFLNDST